MAVAKSAYLQIQVFSLLLDSLQTALAPNDSDNALAFIQASHLSRPFDRTQHSGPSLPFQ